MAQGPSPAQLWPYAEAEQIIRQFGGQTRCFVLETGFGASGLPHIGTFGEVAKTTFIALALRDLGRDSTCLVFSDDRDGLRKIPQGLPAWLEEYLGHPVSAIPDPFDCCPSFAAHMNRLAREMLDVAGFSYTFKSSTEEYARGTFDREILTVLQHYQAVQAINRPTLSEENQEDWFPCFPVCEGCGRLYTTRVREVDLDSRRLYYHCDRPFHGLAGCGHQGWCQVLGGGGRGVKFGWKVDWAMRWHAFGVHYELYGKDLVESAKVSHEILRRVFGTTPPLGLFYELFLAEDESKISKSKGEGLSVQTWLRYASLESLMLLMFKRPRQAKRLYLGIIPRYMAETAEAAREFYGDASPPCRSPVGSPSGTEPVAQAGSELRGGRKLYEFLTLFHPPRESPPPVDFATLCDLLAALGGVADPEIIRRYLPAIAVPRQELERPGLQEILEQAGRYYQEVMLPTLKGPVLKASDRGVLVAVRDVLSGERGAEEIQTAIFAIAQRHGLAPPECFKLLYRLFLGQDRGPRLGHFIKVLGQERVVAKLEAALKELPEVREEVAGSVPTVSPPASRLSGPPTARSLPEEWLVIEEGVRGRFPELLVGMAVLEGVKVQRTHPELETLKGEIIARLAQELDDLPLADLPAVREWRRLYREFGLNPNKYRPGLEVLLEQTFKAHRFPQVNTVVDTMHLVTLQSHCPALAYDLHRLHLPLALRPATVADHFRPVGAREHLSLQEGEVCLADQEEVVGRAFNHRQADRGKVTTRSTAVLVVLMAGREGSREAVAQALQLSCRWLERFSGGQVGPSRLYPAGCA